MSVDPRELIAYLVELKHNIRGIQNGPWVHDGLWRDEDGVLRANNKHIHKGKVNGQEAHRDGKVG